MSGVALIPNTLIDEWLPRLTEAELRALLALYHQTVGVQRSHVALSLRQLLDATGLQSRTHLIAAIRGLVAKQLIQVQQRVGECGEHLPPLYRVGDPDESWPTLAIASPPYTIPPHRPLSARSSEWERALARYGYACAYCGRVDAPLIREHVVPRSQGGTMIVPACTPCNARKGTADWSDRLRDVDGV